MILTFATLVPVVFKHVIAQSWLPQTQTQTHTHTRTGQDSQIYITKTINWITNTTVITGDRLKDLN